LKYLFLNHFAFENIDNSKQDEEILKIFNSLSYLLKNLKKFNHELIFDNKLSLFNFNSKSIHYYIKLMDDKDARVLLITKIQKPTPFCSDSFDKYYEDENIVLGDCVIDKTNISILENFLACAIFLKSPILTIKSICQSNYFLDNTIRIKCNDFTVTLDNFFLEDIEHLKNYLLENSDLKPLNYCKLKFQETNLNFSLIEDKYGFDSLNSNQIKEFLNAFMEFSKMTWEDIIKSDGLEYKQYNKPKKLKVLGWFRDAPYKNTDIYKFRITQKYRCFGYRKGNEFFILRFELDHKISDQG